MMTAVLALGVVAVAAAGLGYAHSRVNADGRRGGEGSFVAWTPADGGSDAGGCGGDGGGCGGGD